MDGATTKKIKNTNLKHPTHTIPSREEILGVFREAKGPLDSGALARALQVNPEAEGVLTRRLNAMERDGQLRANPAGEYALTDHSSFISGRIGANQVAMIGAPGGTSLRKTARWMCVP